jgi:hypothetical protein
MIFGSQAPSSASFCSVLGRHVGVLPTPHVATTPPRSRSGKRPVTVSVLGNQRPEKGYQFMPEVARSLLQSNPDIRILCHNANPDAMRETQEDLHEIAAKNPRLIMDERLACGEVWQQLLDASDLIILPYASPASPSPIPPSPSRRRHLPFLVVPAARPWPVWSEIRRRRAASISPMRRRLSMPLSAHSTASIRWRPWPIPGQNCGVTCLAHAICSTPCWHSRRR